MTLGATFASGEKAWNGSEWAIASRNNTLFYFFRLKGQKCSKKSKMTIKPKK